MTIASGRNFQTTRWSLVSRAAHNDSGAHKALEQLCVIYWEPIYSFLRRTGKSPDDAADLTQGFMARLLEKRNIQGASPDRGRFRSFLLGAVKHFAMNEADKFRAAKRGGGLEHCTLDFELAENHYRRESRISDDPETLFLRRWAMGVLERALQELKARYASEGKAALFSELSRNLEDESHATPYADIAARLSMSENAVKVAAHRLRTRYRESIRAQISDTVKSPAEIDDEIRLLISSLEARPG